MTYKRTPKPKGYLKHLAEAVKRGQVDQSEARLVARTFNYLRKQVWPTRGHLKNGRRLSK